MKKSLWRRLTIRFALYLLRFAGMTENVKFEKPRDITERRKSYLPELANAGYTVDRLTPFQFRINGRLDIYPTNARFHDIKTGKRGDFWGDDLEKFLEKKLKTI